MLIHAQEATEFMRCNVSLYIQLTQAIRPIAQAGRLKFYCMICRGIRLCSSSTDWNMRNSINCIACGHGGRQRHAFEVIEGLIGSPKLILRDRLIFEEVTPFKELLSRRFGNFCGTEYLGSDKVGGRQYIHEGKNIQHEDMCAMSFKDNSMDLIVSMDVLEHVPDPVLAIRECYRVLRPSGFKVMTVPFYDARTTRRRADIVGGKLVHILTPEFHGNPVSSDGALVFTELGQDLLQTMLDTGFEVQISIGADLEKGLLPDGNPTLEAHSWNLVFVLQKPDA